MKKIALFCGIVLSLGFVSCDNFDLPNPPGQENPQLPSFNSDGLELTQGEATINVQKYNDAVENIPVAEVSKLVDFPELYDLVIEMQVAKDDSYVGGITIPTTIVDNIIYVNPDTFNGAIQSAITRDPSTLEVATRFFAYAVYGNSKIQLGDGAYAAYQYMVTPMNPRTVIEESYYMVGSFNNWDVTTGILLQPSQPEYSVYDVPVFVGKFEVTEAQAAEGFEWKVIPASSVTAGNLDNAFGVLPSQDNANSGALIAAEGQERAGVITAASPYLMTVNMEELTYDVTLAIEHLWVAGNGTSQTDFTKMPTLETSNYINYTGVAGLNRQWWLFAEADAHGLQFKQDSKAEPIVDGLVTVGTISSSAEGTIAMPVVNRGIYWIDVNLVALQYKTTYLESVSVVGEFNGWNEKEAFELTPSGAAAKVWKGTVELNGMFKINTNHSWDIDFGGVKEGPAQQTQTIIFKGGNLIAEPGTYDITVDFSMNPYTLTMVKK